MDIPTREGTTRPRSTLLQLTTPILEHFQTTSTASTLGNFGHDLHTTRPVIAWKYNELENPPCLSKSPFLSSPDSQRSVNKLLPHLAFDAQVSTQQIQWQGRKEEDRKTMLTVFSSPGKVNGKDPTPIPAQSCRIHSHQDPPFPSLRRPRPSCSSSNFKNPNAGNCRVYRMLRTGPSLSMPVAQRTMEARTRRIRVPAMSLMDSSRRQPAG